VSSTAPRSSPDAGAAHDSRRQSPGDPASLVLLAGCVIAGVLVLAFHLPRLGDPFDAERHAWGSAHFATIARSYAEQGFIALRGLPIGNNPPLGLAPDAYVHWPPLFAILLGVVFKMFGAGEAVARAFMLVIGAALVLATGWVGALVYGRRGAVASMFAMLTIPVFVGYVCLVQLTTLGLLFMVLAVAGFLRAAPDGTIRTRWLVFGLVATVASVCSSWEPAFLPIGLLAIALVQRDRTRVRIALAYGIAVFVGVALVFGLFFLSVSGLWEETWRTAIYRTGLGAYGAPTEPPIHAIVGLGSYTERLTPGELLGIYARQFRESLGWIYPLTLITALVMAVRRVTGPDRDARWTPVILLAPPLLWFTIMSNQSADNDFETLTAMPACAVSFAVVVCAAWSATTPWPRRWNMLRVGALAVLVGVLLWPLWSAQQQGYVPQTPTGMLDYAHGIHDHTEPGAVVISPVSSLVPVYYSRRHIIRGIADGAALTYVLRRAAIDFPGAPVYLAIPPTADPVPDELAARRVAAGDSRLNLFLLRPGR